MKVPTRKEIEAKKKKDWNPIDKFFMKWITYRTMLNDLQKVVDYVESQK